MTPKEIDDKLSETIDKARAFSQECDDECKGYIVDSVHELITGGFTRTSNCVLSWTEEMTELCPKLGMGIKKVRRAGDDYDLYDYLVLSLSFEGNFPFFEYQKRLETEI